MLQLLPSPDDSLSWRSAWLSCLLLARDHGFGCQYRSRWRICQYNKHSERSSRIKSLDFQESCFHLKLSERNGFYITTKESKQDNYHGHLRPLFMFTNVEFRNNWNKKREMQVEMSKLQLRLLQQTFQFLIILCHYRKKKFFFVWAAAYS